jgi:hypothetical protein
VEYFGAAAGRRVRGRWGPAQVVTATNSFPHIADLDDYFAGLDLALDDDGVFVVEAHYLGDFLAQTAVDTVYHEHVSYWSLGALAEAARRRGFEVVSAARLDIHHGQLRAVLSRTGRRPVGESVGQLLAEEERAGLRDRETWNRWAARAGEIARELREGLGRLTAEGWKVMGYGAPAKATTLLNYAGVGAADLPLIADKSPLKQGRWIPGCRIPVVSVEQALAERPDATLVLAWNIAGEVARELDGYRSAGGRLFVPVPRFVEYGAVEELALHV